MSKAVKRKKPRACWRGFLFVSGVVDQTVDNIVDLFKLHEVAAQF